MSALRTSIRILVRTVICLIVLVGALHLAAVGGIYAFGRIQQSHKSHR